MDGLDDARTWLDVTMDGLDATIWLDTTMDGRWTLDTTLYGLDATIWLDKPMDGLDNKRTRRTWLDMRPMDGHDGHLLIFWTRCDLIRHDQRYERLITGIQFGPARAWSKNKVEWFSLVDQRRFPTFFASRLHWNESDWLLNSSELSSITGFD